MAEALASRKKQAEQTLGSLAKEIDKAEKELAALREEADIRRQLLAKPIVGGKAAGGRQKERIDWASVLNSLPKEFTARDLIAKSNKSPATVYSQLYQMAKANRLKRTKTGYMKLSHTTQVSRLEERQRKNSPMAVLKESDAAYRAHKEEWDQKYAGQHIAVYQGEVIDADKDKTRLVKRIIKKQKERGRFRACLIQIGAPLLELRGPE